MFKQKKTHLFKVKSDKETPNKFIAGSLETNRTTSQEGSIKYESTGSDFLDQFASASKYRQPRSYEDISKDMMRIWGVDPILTIKFTLYLRLITRKVSDYDGNVTDTVQKGQGLKHESIMRMIWLHVNHPEAFASNVMLFVYAGSWKDIIQMMQYDAMYNGTDKKLDWDFLASIISAGLSSKHTSELVKKYLPTIRSKHRCTTVESQANNIVAKHLCQYIFGEKSDANPGKTFAQYRRLKSSGTAHQWQQAISKGKFKDINFNTIAGRALHLLASSKFLQNQKLVDDYTKWIESKPAAKFTGYVFELFKNISMYSEKHVNITANKQFEELLTKAKIEQVDGGLLPVLDTSGSMTSLVPGINMTAMAVGKSLTLFMSELLKGPFYGHYYEFSDNAILRKFEGETYIDKYLSAKSSIIGTTRFTSVADKLVETLKVTGSEEDFPTGIIAFSDGEFHNTNPWFDVDMKTESAYFKEILLNGGFSKQYVEDFKIILWDIPNSYYGNPKPTFDALGDTPNTFLIGGFDASIISFLMNPSSDEHRPAVTTAELFNEAMNQELLNLVKL